MGALIYFLLIAALFAVMMSFGCGAHVLGHRGKVGSGGQTHLVPPNKDKDAVCGMTVETAKAKSSAYAGRLYHFCSTSCCDKFGTVTGHFYKLHKQRPFGKGCSTCFTQTLSRQPACLSVEVSQERR